MTHFQPLLRLARFGQRIDFGDDRTNAAFINQPSDFHGLSGIDLGSIAEGAGPDLQCLS
jgi:hypothetical protein